MNTMQREREEDQDDDEYDDEEHITRQSMIRQIKDGRARLLLDLAYLEFLEEQVRQANPKDAVRLRDLQHQVDMYNEGANQYQFVGPMPRDEYVERLYGPDAVAFRRDLQKRTQDWRIRINPEMVQKAVAMIKKRRI